MKKGYEKIIQYLLLHKHATSKELASELQVSSRTIHTYIKEINHVHKNQMILASQSGYRLCADETMVQQWLNEETTSQVPIDFDERARFIIKVLLNQKENKIDLYELCDQLYISYSTLKLEISKMNSVYRSFGIHFSVINDHLYIEGDEKSKRKLVSQTIYCETNENFIDIPMLKQCFSEQQVDAISSIILSITKQFHLLVNDFSYSNLLLHMNITLDRVQKGHMIHHATKIEDTPQDQPLRKAIKKLIEVHFHITLNVQEQNEILILIKTNTTTILQTQEQSLKQYVNDDMIKIVSTIIQHTNEIYYLSLGEEFLFQLSLHIKGHLFRCQTGNYTKNPMLPMIKKNCPVIYDIAVCISQQLYERYPYEIPEDEIGFISLHIGAEIERQKSKQKKLNCLLVCPDYQNLNRMLFEDISQDFKNLLNIKLHIIQDSEVEETIPYDLVITTIPYHQIQATQTFYLPPFQYETQKIELYALIKEMHDARKYEILKNNFQYYFEPELFLYSNTYQTRDEVISLLCKKMEALAYTDENFISNIQLRESFGSTAFDLFAIPHSLNHQGVFRTNVGIVINKDGIAWGNQRVYIVTLLAISERDREVFSDLYEAFIALLNKHAKEVIQSARTLERFQKILML